MATVAFCSSTPRKPNWPLPSRFPFTWMFDERELRDRLRLDVEAVRVDADDEVHGEVDARVEVPGQLHVPAELVEREVERNLARVRLREADHDSRLGVRAGVRDAGGAVAEERELRQERRGVGDRPVVDLVEKRPAVGEREERREAAGAAGWRRRASSPPSGSALGAAFGSARPPPAPAAAGRAAARRRALRAAARAAGSGPPSARSRPRSPVRSTESRDRSCSGRVGPRGEVREGDGLGRTAADLDDLVDLRRRGRPGRVDLLDLRAFEDQRVGAGAAGEEDAARDVDRAVRAVDRERVGASRDRR